MALMTLSELKTYLRIEHTDGDTFLNQSITLATSIAERYTGRQFSVISKTKYDEGGGEFLVFMPPPIVSIVSITPESGTGTVLDSEDYDYYPDSGLIYRTDKACWADGGNRYWEIVGSVGFSTPPDSAKTAAMQLIGKYWETKDPNIISERIGDWGKSEDPNMTHFKFILNDLKLDAF